MFGKIINKLSVSSESLEDLLFQKPFDEKKANDVFQKTGFDLEKKDQAGQSLLQKCLDKRLTKAAVWLIEKGVDISKGDKESSMLRFAVENNLQDVTYALLKTGQVNINQVDNKERSLLQDAVISGHKSMIRTLIEFKIDLNIVDNRNRNVLFDAINYGDETIIKMILDAQPKINLNQVDFQGNTILHHKSVLADENFIEMLLSYGADPTICNSSGENLLTFAALKGKEGEHILDMAINAGFNLNAKTNTTKTNVFMEVIQAFTKVSDFEKNRRNSLKYMASKLINNGIDVKALNGNDENALFDAVRANDIEACGFLLENDVVVDQINKDFQTPLSIAVTKGIDYLDVVLLLLEYGANPLLKIDGKRNILEILNLLIGHNHNCCELEDKALLNIVDSNAQYMVVLKEVLSKCELEENFLDSHGDPYTFFPFLHGDINTCHMFLKAGIDINAKNIHGHTLFFEYNIQAFHNRIHFEEYKKNIVFLLANKANHLITDNHGQMIYAKVAMIKECDLRLFRKLAEITKFDYHAKDNLGRTILHSCVFGKNLELLKIIYGVERNIQNMEDNYNMYPITYAALMGEKEIVYEFLRRDVIITSNKPIAPNAKKQFRPFLKNIVILGKDLEDKDLKRKVAILQDQIIRDFK